MITTTIFPGRYVQGAEALQELGPELRRFGTRALVLCDPWVLDNLLPSFRGPLEQTLAVTIIERFGGECSDEEIGRLTERCRSEPVDMAVGIGGGKTLDTAKAVSEMMRLRKVCVPTLASTDAPTSALSVIYTPESAFKRYYPLTTNPDLVLVDTRVVADAPVRFLVSGMGDALATWFEAESCQRAFSPNLTGRVGAMSAFALARLCYETLIGYGSLAKASCEARAVTPALERIVEANTLLSGLGFESGGLASAHAIHNGLTVLEQTHSAHHGEKVALGTLASLFLTNKSSDVIDEVYSFCEVVGLPTTLTEIGLGAAGDQDLLKVAEAACAEGETIHNEPMQVTPDMVLAALKAADAEGRQRLGMDLGLAA